VPDRLTQLGLSKGQIARFAEIQAAGRKIDFVYHYTDDGSDPRHAASQFNEFRARLKAFAGEGEVPRQFAVALWDHLAPRFVGWRPEFSEGVEAGNLSSALVHLDEDIDARLGRNIPPDLRVVSQEVRERFDDLSFLYDSGAWRDSRTAGDVRDELAFVASLDEKIRNVLYGNAREIDVRRTIEEHFPVREAGREYFTEAAFEARSYQAQIARVSDLLDRMRAAGIEVHAGLTFGAPSESLRQRAPDATREPVPTRPAPAPKDMRKVAAVPQPSADAENYWCGIARSASDGAALGQSQSLAQGARRGRSL
jgi:hypothetical protein